METDTGIKEDVCCLVCWDMNMIILRTGVLPAVLGFRFGYCIKFLVDVLFKFPGVSIIVSYR